MITRISEIRGIGCLKNMRPDKGGEYGFGKHTVILAPNATGKTTLAAVLKSYGAEDPTLIGSRATLSASGAPFAIVDIDNAPRRFENGSWHGRAEAEYRFAVFDNAFIEENVFSGEVTPDHLKTIHKLIVGRDGLALNVALESAKEAERNARRELNRLNGELKERQNATARQDYLDLPNHMKPDEAASRVEACEGKLKARKDMGAGQTAPLPSIEPLALGNFAALRNALGATVATAHEEARTRVKERIRTVLREAPEAESFLATGKLLAPEDGQCPFCGQDTAPVASLLQDYEHYFDKAFAEFKKDITERVVRFRAWSPSGHLRKWQSQWSQAVAAREKWSQVIPSLPLLPDVGTSIDKVAEEADELHTACVKEMEKKTLSLEAKLDLAQLDDLERLLAELKEKADACLPVCQTMATKIEEFRRTLQASSIDELNKEVARARAIAEALSPEAEAWRKRYRDADAKVAALEEARKKAESALDVYCRRTYAEFQGSINEVLKDFRLRLTVSSLQPRSTQQSSQVSADMSLGIDGCPVSAAKRQTSTPCFRNTLSEGEKNALAFAFFLADLKRCGNISNMIVIIDDPLSSFDDDRRLDTARHLARLGKDCRQLIVLTHRMDLVGLLYDQNEFDGRFLKLAHDNTQGARIDLLDVKKEQLLDHEKHVQALVAFAECGTLPVGDSVQRLIRAVLECGLRTKYCHRLTGERELTALLRKLVDDLKLIDANVAQELRDLNKLSQQGLHAATDQAPARSLTTPDLQGLAVRTLDVLVKI